MSALTLPEQRRDRRAELVTPPPDPVAIRLATIYRAVGLSGNPFMGDPRSGPFVAVPSHVEAMATLLPWLEHDAGSGLALVTGRPGSGRTRLMLHLGETLASRSDLTVAPVHSGDERRTDAQLLRAIVEALGGEPTGRTGLELTNGIRTLIAQNQAGDRRSVILIDDAMFTGSQLEIVRTLLSSASGVSLVLFGPPELRERIGRRRSLAGSLRSTISLGAMDRDATETFLAGRIAAMRLSTGRPEPEPLFTDEAIAIVTDWSEGNPGAVIRIAGECVLEAIACSQTVVDRRVAHRVARELTDHARHQARLVAAAPFSEPAVQTRLMLDLEPDREGTRS
jgi:type II secretory pathway predicted ATPase ExeA